MVVKFKATKDSYNSFVRTDRKSSSSFELRTTFERCTLNDDLLEENDFSQKLVILYGRKGAYDRASFLLS